nr:MAG TPA: hypothetical protein [Caudoviricetes sp.]
MQTVQIDRTLSAAKLKRRLNIVRTELKRLEQQIPSFKKKGPLFANQLKVAEQKHSQLCAEYVSLVGYYTNKGTIANIGNECYVGDYVITSLNDIGPLAAAFFSSIVEETKNQSDNQPTEEVTTMTTPTKQTQFVFPEAQVPGVNYLTPESVALDKVEAAKIVKAVKPGKAQAKLFEQIEEAADTYDGSTESFGNVFSTVRRYILAMEGYKVKVDPNNVLTQATGIEIVDAAAKSYYGALEQTHATEEEAVQAMEVLTTAVQNTPEEEKETWTHKITVGFKNTVGLCWDFTKGAFSYLVNGVWYIVKAAVALVFTVFRTVLGIVDAATTKDFGRSGEKGLIAKGLAGELDVA